MAIFEGNQGSKINEWWLKTFQATKVKFSPGFVVVVIVVKSYYIEIWFHISYSATWDENSVQSWNYHDEVSMPSAKKDEGEWLSLRTKCWGWAAMPRKNMRLFSKVNWKSLE